MQHIDNDLQTIAGTDVTKKRKSPLGAILMIVAGLGLAVTDKFAPGIAESPNLASAVMMTGWVLFFAGLIVLMIRLLGNTFDLYYTPSGEKLKKYEYSFEAPQREKVREIAVKGDFKKLASIPQSPISAVKLTLYAIPGKDVLWSQVFEFVPHSHVPVTDIIAYPKGTASL